MLQGVYLGVHKKNPAPLNSIHIASISISNHRIKLGSRRNLTHIFGTVRFSNKYIQVIIDAGDNLRLSLENLDGDGVVRGV